MVSSTCKVLLVILITPVISKKVKLGPHWDHRERTTCEEFGRYARFNPYTMPNDTWIVFYYWAPQPDSFFIHFDMPSRKNYTYLHNLLDDRVSIPVNWTAKHVLVKIGYELALLVEQGDRGEYLMYNMNEAISLPAERKMTPLEVRMKQTGDSKFVGMMFCKKEIVYALVRLSELPRKHQLQDAAARLNYQSRGGKSYLYQGHHWMPVPEQDDEAYWSRPSEHFTRETVW